MKQIKTNKLQKNKIFNCFLFTLNCKLCYTACPITQL